ncbi:MAG: tRNA1(Val) (adenine(37)-N6)-methyltransferase [Flavobacteriales bacterium]
MRISSDAVLFGAWATPIKPALVLDVGCGTGLLTLQLAQRFSNIRLHAIEIESGAYKNALYNIRNSPWKNRISVEKADFLELHANHPIDFIICNPPFFNATKSKFSSHLSRRIARQDNYLPLCKLIKKSYEILSSDGEMALLLPFERLWDIRAKAAETGFYFSRLTTLSSFSSSEPIRLFIQMSKKICNTDVRYLTMYSEKNKLTSEVEALTKDFYLG